MLTRRVVMMSAAGATLAPSFGALAAPVPDTKLDPLFDAFFRERLLRAPETATGLGLDHGEYGALKSRLTDVSLAAIAQEKTDCARRVGQLKAIDRAALSGLPAVNYDTVLFTLEVQDEANRLFDYGRGGARSPYVLSQLAGAYQEVPDFLDTQHKIETVSDCDAYLARLQAFARVMDQEIEVAEHDARIGVSPPDFIIDKALVQMRLFLATPAAKAVVVSSLARRTAAKGLDAGYATRAAGIYRDAVLPALQRQVDWLVSIRPHAVHEAGVARLPKGADFYRMGVKFYTTATISAAAIHQTGLDLVASLSADLDKALRAQGMKDGSVGQRLVALGAEPRFIYANTDEAKEQLIADLNKKVVAVQGCLPAYFSRLPKAPVEIRRVPKAIEAGAPGGYYQHGTLDGSRPGAYYINLRDTAELPRWALPTLTFHESIPGHHLQITLSNETPGLPLIRKIGFFSGYGEGWALYAEQLAVEMGMYVDDPLGHIGQLQAALFRAVRLVVDSGIHSMGWSREKAVDYFIDTLGEKRSAAVSEVERYCVWPGQACSYMLGKLDWLRQRERAKTALGARFDLKAFHAAGLGSGGMPLGVLDRVIEEYIAASRVSGLGHPQ
jgi:uncharacterized protein (DUF885 family)